MYYLTEKPFEQERKLLNVGRVGFREVEALQAFRGEDFYQRYGRRIHEGWTMLTARFGSQEEKRLS